MSCGGCKASYVQLGSFIAHNPVRYVSQHPTACLGSKGHVCQAGRVQSTQIQKEHGACKGGMVQQGKHEKDPQLACESGLHSCTDQPTLSKFKVMFCDYRSTTLGLMPRDRIKAAVDECNLKPKELVRLRAYTGSFLNCLDSFRTRLSFVQLKHFGLCRRDKYQRKIKEYWVETGTEGTFQKEDESEFREGWAAEGECGDDFQLGGPNPGPLGDNSSDDDDTDSDDDDDRKSRPKAKPGKRSNPGKKNDLEEEAALEVRRVTPCFNLHILLTSL